MQTTTRKAQQDDIVVTKTIDAAPNRVRDAWRNEALLRQWWGPEGYTCPVARVDERIGGETITCMRSAEGKEFWGKAIYHDISQERLIYADSFSDADGGDKAPADYGIERWPLKSMVTVTFVEDGGKTRMTLRHSGLGNVPQATREECKEGWTQSFDKLARVIAQN